MAEQPWHSLTPEEVRTKLETDFEQGLPPEEAARRLEAYGRNELREQPRPGFLQRLLGQFKDIVVILLIFAALVSALLGEWPEAIAIMLIVVLNAVLGVVQEGRAEAALAALKKMSAPEARVLRGGKVVDIPEAEVVPGDVVLIEAGSYIPADMRLVETANMQIEEASLTGESVPANKDAKLDLEPDASLGDRKNMAYKSTTSTYGRGKGIVTSTGMETEIGKIAEMIQAVEEESTPLQMRLDELGRWLVYFALVMVGIVFVIQFSRVLGEHAVEQGLSLRQYFGTLFDGMHPAEMAAMRDAGIEAFLTAVALAVAAVPEGLPAIVTINLALGMREMIKRNALIRRLPAVETLGSASIICSDKTGTLTQNEMTVVEVYVPEKTIKISGRGYAPYGTFSEADTDVEPTDMPDVYHLLRGGLLASDALLEEDKNDNVDPVFRIVGDPTEGALVVAAAKAGMGRKSIETSYPRINELPFDSIRKRMSTLHTTPEGDVILFAKGAPDIMLDLCASVQDNDEIRPLTDEMKQHIRDINSEMASKALRVLAVAQRIYPGEPEGLTVENDEKDLTFVGLLGMIDPARPAVKPAIARARSAGIKTVMVTGDYPDTARAIAAEIGLLHAHGQVVTGKQLQAMSDPDLRKIVHDVDVFARVSPEHKVRIVDAFRQEGDVVAMTGDGVNDAPALKRASIGVAMGITGTDVSKETADMVLTDDNYVSIVNAVEQGRIIYDNIRKFVAFLLTSNMSEIMVILIASLLGAPSPLTAIQLLWLNLITDGAPALALGVEPADPDVMDRPPRPPEEPIIDRVLGINLVVQTIFKTGVTLAAYFLTLNGTIDFGSNVEPLLAARTMAFTVLSFTELARAYSARSEVFSIFKIGIFSNKYMQYAVGVSILLLLMVIYVPFFNPIFDTSPIDLAHWGIIIPLVFLPAVAAEITKMFTRNAHGSIEKDDDLLEAA